MSLINDANTHVMVERPKHKLGWDVEGYVANMAGTAGEFWKLVTSAVDIPGCTRCTVQGEAGYLLLEDVVAGDLARLAVSEDQIAPVICAGALNSGTEVMTSAAGHAIAWVAGAANHCLGVTQAPSLAALHKVALEVKYFSD